MIPGRRPVLEALRHGRLTRIFVAAEAKGEPVKSIRALAGRKGVPLSIVSRAELDRLAGGAVHQGVVAQAPPYRYLELAELIEAAGAETALPLLLLLDHLQDPQNLGSIIRTADAAGVQGIIIPERRSAGITPAVRKVAAGAAERMRVARTKNSARAMEELKQAGYWVYGADAGGRVPFDRADYGVPLALVIGSEGKGLSALVRRRCDETVFIPMRSAAGSLNAAVAAALIIYAAAVRREDGRMF